MWPLRILQIESVDPARGGDLMTDPQIMRVDRETYKLGKRVPHFWSSNKELKFYEIRCNWGINRQT